MGDDDLDLLHVGHYREMSTDLGNGFIACDRAALLETLKAVRWVDQPRGDGPRRFQNPMASRSSRTVPRPGMYSALRMSRRLMALGIP